MDVSKSVAEQIETAYDYRGHVTLTLNDGTVVEGFLFNREVTPLKGIACTNTTSYQDIVPHRRVVFASPMSIADKCISAALEKNCCKRASLT